MESNLAYAIIKGGYHEAISQKLEEVKSQIESCNQLISTRKTHQEGLVVTEEDVRKYIGKLKDYIKDPLCKEQAKLPLSQFAHRVEISNEEVKAMLMVAFAAFNASGQEYKYPHECQCNNQRKKLLQTYGEERPQKILCKRRDMTVLEILAKSRISPRY